MNRSAPRSIDQYLKALREALAGEDAALIQDALYDAEEYLRAEVAAHPDKSESDVLELIASTYGAPDEVASAYRDTEAKVKAAMTTPRKIPKGGAGVFFGVFEIRCLGLHPENVGEGRNRERFGDGKIDPGLNLSHRVFDEAHGPLAMTALVRRRRLQGLHRGSERG